MKDLYKKLLYLLRNERYYTILNEGKQQQHDAEKFGHKFAVVVAVCLVLIQCYEIIFVLNN